MVGTVVAQVIPLAASLALVRLFTPAQFGIFSAVAGIAVVLSIIASLRYEVAIVLPQNDDVAAQLLGLSVLLCTSIAVAALLVGSLASHARAALLGPANDVWWTVPLIAWLIGMSQALGYVANRNRSYGLLASTMIAQQGCASLVAILVGLASFSFNGLIIGRVGGLLAALILFVWVLRQQHAKGLMSAPNFRRLMGAASAYRQFPLFNVPYSLAAAFSREFLILAFTAFHQVEAAGFYGLARSILMAPTSFLSSSFSQVFYREAAGSIHTPEFKKLMILLMNGIGVSLAPLFVFGWLWAPTIFSVVFGQRWSVSGEYAALIMPIGFLSLFTSWPERVFEVSNKQQYSFSIQTSFDVLSIAVVFLLLRSGSAPIDGIKAYVGIQCVYHLSYMLAVFVVGSLGTREYLKCLTVLASTVISSIIAQQFVVSWGTSITTFIGSLALALAASAVGLYFVWKSSRQPDLPEGIIGSIE